MARGALVALAVLALAGFSAAAAFAQGIGPPSPQTDSGKAEFSVPPGHSGLGRDLAPGEYTLITLRSNDGQEPPFDLSDGDARAAWAAASAPWHPAVLAVSKALPTLEDAAFASSPAADEVRIIAAGARDRLRDRQSAVLAEVLAGRVPDSFDGRTTRVTGLVLRSKRRRAALGVLPFLAAVPDLAERFDEYALEHPVAGCAHDDGDAFAGWAQERGLLRERAALDGWREREVELGRRRFAVVGRGRRRRLVVGIGSWVYDTGRGSGWTR